MKKSIAVVVAALLSVSATVSADDKAFAAFACQNLVLDYAWHWDHDNHEDFANLFTDDANFQAAGRQHTGRDEIYAEQKKRTGTVVTRTFFTNVRAIPVSDDTVEATSYLMVHSEPRPDTTSRRATSPEFRYDNLSSIIKCKFWEDNYRFQRPAVTQNNCVERAKEI